jgi:hypothetical protein
VALGSQALEDLDHVWESRSKLTGHKREEGEKAKGKKKQGTDTYKMVNT